MRAVLGPGMDEEDEDKVVVDVGLSLFVLEVDVEEEDDKREVGGVRSVVVGDAVALRWCGSAL